MVDLPRSPDDIERLQGSPPTLRSSATDLRTIASNLTIAGTACSDLMSVCDGTSWRGQGFNNFRSKLEQNPKKQDVDNAKRIMGDAASALDRLAARVADAQDRIERCRTRLYNLNVPTEGDIPGHLEPQLLQIRNDANDARGDYRSAVREAGNRFAELTDKTTYAGPPPDFFGRAARFVGGLIKARVEFEIGVLQGAYEMVKGVAMITYRINAPWMFERNVRDLRKIYLSARDNPGEFLKNVGKAAADWDTLMSNPARWAGKLVPSVALSVATGGAGTAASAAGRAGAVASRVGRMGRVTGKLDNAAGALRHVDNAANVFKTTAAGREAARQIDAMTRPIRNGAGRVARAVTGRTGTPAADDVNLPDATGGHTFPEDDPQPEPVHVGAENDGGPAPTAEAPDLGGNDPIHHDSSPTATHDRGSDTHPDASHPVEIGDGPDPRSPGPVNDGDPLAAGPGRQPDTTHTADGLESHAGDPDSATNPINTGDPAGPRPVRDVDPAVVGASDPNGSVPDATHTATPPVRGHNGASQPHHVPDATHTATPPVRGHDGATQPTHIPDTTHTEPVQHIDQPFGRHDPPGTARVDEPEMVAAGAAASQAASARVGARTGDGGGGVPPRNTGGPGGGGRDGTPPRGHSGGVGDGGTPPRGPGGDPPRTPPPGRSPNQGPWRDPSRYDEWRDRWFRPDRPTRTPNGEPTTVPSQSPRYPLPDPPDPIAARGIVERPDPGADDHNTRNKWYQEENRDLLEEHGFPMRNNDPAAPNPVNPDDPDGSTADYQNRDDGRLWDHKVPEGNLWGPYGARSFARSLDGSATRFRDRGKQADRFVVDMTYAKFTPENLLRALEGLPDLGVQEVIIVEGGVPSPLFPRIGEPPRHWPDDLPPDGSSDGPGTPPPPRPPAGDTPSARHRPLDGHATAHTGGNIDLGGNGPDNPAPRHNSGPPSHTGAREPDNPGVEPDPANGPDPSPGDTETSPADYDPFNPDRDRRAESQHPADGNSIDLDPDQERSADASPEQVPDWMLPAEDLWVRPLTPDEPGFGDMVNEGPIKWAVDPDGHLGAVPHTLPNGDETTHAIILGRNIDKGATGVAHIATGGPPRYRRIGLHIDEDIDQLTPSLVNLLIGRAAFERYGITFPPNPEHSRRCDPGELFWSRLYHLARRGRGAQE